MDQNMGSFRAKGSCLSLSDYALNFGIDTHYEKTRACLSWTSLKPGGCFSHIGPSPSSLECVRRSGQFSPWRELQYENVRGHVEHRRLEISLSKNAMAATSKDQRNK